MAELVPSPDPSHSEARRGRGRVKGGVAIGVADAAGALDAALVAPHHMTAEGAGSPPFRLSDGRGFGRHLRIKISKVWVRCSES